MAIFTSKQRRMKNALQTMLTLAFLTFEFEHIEPSESMPPVIEHLSKFSFKLITSQSSETDPNRMLFKIIAAHRTSVGRVCDEGIYI